jgi:predicted nucleic acid-binding protein
VAVGLTLDSEVLSALADDDPRAVAVIKAAREVGAVVHVPAVVLAETTTGDPGRDASLNRVVGRLTIEAVDEQVGRIAGGLRFVTGMTDATLDALVVATAAVRGGGRLVSVDPDVRQLAEHASVRVTGLPGREP